MDPTIPPPVVKPACTAATQKTSDSGLHIRIGFFTSIMPISSPNPVFEHLLESSHRDNSIMWSNIGFGEEITLVVLIEVNFYAYNLGL